MNVTWKVLAIMLGFMALHADLGIRNDNFVRGAVERGKPVLESNFTGIHWSCGRRGRHTCWAGRVHLHGETELMTGRYHGW